MVSTWTAVFPYTPGARYDANSGPCILQQQLRHVVRTALHPSHMCQRKCSSRLSINCSLATQQKISHAALPRDVWTYAWDADKSNTTAKVKVAVRKAEGCYQVEVMAEGTANGTPIEISWGLYRSDPRKWFSPAEVTVTPGTGEPDPDNPGASRSSLIQDPVGERPGPWIQVSIPAHLAPVTLAFRLKGVAPDIRNPKEGRPFTVPIGMGQGHPLPLGANLLDLPAEGSSGPGAAYSVNFAVVSRHAEAMSIVLARYNPAEPSKRLGKVVEIALDPVHMRSGDVWHVLIHNLRDLQTLCYGWRADGDSLWQAASRFSPGRLMLDPYARAVEKVLLPEGVHVVAPKGGKGPPENPPALMSCLAPLVEPLGGTEGLQRPRHSLETSLVLEVDVRSFTSPQSFPAASQEVPPERQGKLLGILDKLGALGKMGISALMLSSVMLSGPGPGPSGASPINFFTVDPDLAVGSDPLAPARELCQLAQSLHDAGIELWLQVEFCFTGEGGDKQSEAQSLRGLDAAVYYRQGQLLNCGHATVRHLILDSLRYWATLANVDGFVFVNAETLTLDREGVVLDHPPLLEAIAADPLLPDVKLVAWLGDPTLLPRNGQRGFPHGGVWLERNTRFTRDFLQFLGEGRHGKASAVATRVLGSPDLFAPWTEGGYPGGLAVGRRPSFGLNGIAAVGGESLSDICNRLCGGLTAEAAVERLTLAKSLLLACLMSQGTPLLPQSVVWDGGLFQFVSRAVQVRALCASLLLPPQFDDGRDIRWHGDRPGSEPDWDESRAASSDSWGADFVAYSVTRVVEEEEKAVYLGYNPHNGIVQLSLPPPPEGTVWGRLIDTSLMPPEDVKTAELVELPGREYGLAGKAAILLTAVRKFAVPKAAPPAAAPSPPLPAA